MIIKMKFIKAKLNMKIAMPKLYVLPCIHILLYTLQAVTAYNITLLCFNVVNVCEFAESNSLQMKRLIYLPAKSDAYEMKRKSTLSLAIQKNIFSAAFQVPLQSQK